MVAIEGAGGSTDRLSLLQDARARLVAAMNGELTCRSCARGVDPPLAGVIRELRAVLDAIDKTPGSSEVTKLDVIAAGVTDQLAARRANKGAAG